MLEELRKEIDRCDRNIVSMLKERMSISKKIGEYKKKNGIAVHHPMREKELLERLCELASEDLPAESIELIYREIISASRKVQT
ncbi:MAG: chorismate mutase [Rickettsiales bacterium]|jgi:monofunctional chorismate mutase|nr:chorismate mutase [Rickettsiales bacterium]